MLVFRQSFEKCCDVDVCNNMIREDVDDIGFEMRIEHTQEKINLLAIARVWKVEQPGRRPHGTFDSKLLAT